MERSTLAWFRADLADAPDETAALIDALRDTYDVDVITEAQAHDFVWKHFRAPYDLCVYELSHAASDEFMLAYLVHYPGVLLLMDASSHPAHEIPAAPIVVVRQASSAQTMQDLFPDACVRHAPLPVRAVQNDADIVIALDWPVTPHSLTRALRGIAAGKAVVVFECDATADWPALNPQTWQPRGSSPDAPIVVSIDPRDEQHSLTLAVKRLTTDAALRGELGAAARAWWASHATIDHAVRAWKAILDGAMTLPAFSTHASDGTERAREILAEFGVDVDFLR